MTKLDLTPDDESDGGVWMLIEKEVLLDGTVVETKFNADTGEYVVEKNGDVVVERAKRAP